MFSELNNGSGGSGGIDWSKLVLKEYHQKTFNINTYTASSDFSLVIIVGQGPNIFTSYLTKNGNLNAWDEHYAKGSTYGVTTDTGLSQYDDAFYFYDVKSGDVFSSTDASFYAYIYCFIEK